MSSKLKWQMLIGMLWTNLVQKLADSLQTPLLQASTSEVYGCAEVSQQSEEYKGNVNCTGIRACYDESKRAAEAMCFHYTRTFGTQVRVVRIFNTYGPYMDRADGRVVSNFINQALDNKPLTVYDGRQTRSLCYIDDLVDGLLRMIHSSEIGPINLGNTEEITIDELTKVVTSLAGSKSMLERYPLPEDDPPQRCPDITLAKSRLGWSPSTNLTEGIVKTIEYFRQMNLIYARSPT